MHLQCNAWVKLRILAIGMIAGILCEREYFHRSLKQNLLVDMQEKRSTCVSVGGIAVTGDFKGLQQKMYLFF